eukprot:SAG31_NODE_262_length_18842_cov_22.033346_14_plen_150_part_00
MCSCRIGEQPPSARQGHSGDRKPCGRASNGKRRSKVPLRFFEILSDSLPGASALVGAPAAPPSCHHAASASARSRIDHTRRWRRRQATEPSSELAWPPLLRLRRLRCRLVGTAGPTAGQELCCLPHHGCPLQLNLVPVDLRPVLGRLYR